MLPINRAGPWRANRDSEQVRVKVREVVRRIQADGWYLARTRGSHRQFKHPTKPGIVTVAGKPGIDVPIGTLNNIWHQAQLEEDS